MVITKPHYAASSREYGISVYVESNVVGGRDGYSIEMRDVLTDQRIGMVWRLDLAEAIAYAERCLA